MTPTQKILAYELKLIREVETVIRNRYHCTQIPVTKILLIRWIAFTRRILAYF